MCRTANLPQETQHAREEKSQQTGTTGAIGIP
jgi:hypothetical protein